VPEDFVFLISEEEVFSWSPFSATAPDAITVMVVER
jgi:hypothetical protein